MAEAATTVSCAKCDVKLTVSSDAVRHPQRLEDQLAVGWTLTWERDKDTGKYGRVLYCPLHRPSIAQEPT